MEHDASSKDEIDLLDLALTLWSKRLVLIGTTLISIFAGLLLTSYQSVSYRGEMQIHPLNSSELTGFDLWNETIVTSSWQGGAVANDTIAVTSDGSSAVTSDGSSAVTSDGLMKAFQSNYLRGASMNAALRQHSKAVRNFEGNEEELLALLNKLISNYEIERTESGIFKITFDTHDKTESLKILSTTLDLISEDVKNNMLRSFRSKLEAATLSRELKLKNTSIEIETYAQLYEARKARTLTIMREQAAVARQLGIDNPVNALPDKPNSTGNINFENPDLGPFESRYFLQGYRAIEKQIANLQQRVESEYGPLISEVDPLILERARLQAYNPAEFLSPLLDRIPLNDADFKVVRVDISGTKFVSQSKKMMIVIMFGIAGLLLAMIYILLQQTIQTRQSNVKQA